MHAVILVAKNDHASFQMIGFSDASFVNNRNISTQMEFIVFLPHVNL